MESFIKNTDIESLVFVKLLIDRELRSREIDIADEEYKKLEEALEQLKKEESQTTIEIND